MFRKLALALAATAALGTASLAVEHRPCRGQEGGFHHSIITTAITTTGMAHSASSRLVVLCPATGGCYVKRWVADAVGLRVLRWVNVCF